MFLIVPIIFSLLMLGIWIYFIYKLPLFKDYLDRINKFIARRKAYFYKRKKVKESKLDFDNDYQFTFRLVLRDSDGSHLIEKEYFNITIPAKATFVARKKLERWVEENITIDIVEIKNLNEQND